MSNKTIGSISLESQLLFDRLLKGKEGEVVTYEELSTIIKRNVQTEARHNLQTARNKLLAEHGIWYDVVSGLGVKRCNDSEKVQVGKSYMRRIRKQALKGARITLSVENYDKLPRDEKAQHNAQVSMYGALAHMASERQLKKLKGKVEEAQSRLSLPETMKAFGV